MIINGTSITYPSSLNYDIEEVGSNYTTMSGKTIVDIVRTKRILECGWSALTETELKEIIALLNNKIVTVKYYEPLLLADATKKFVVSDIKFGTYTLQDNKKIFDSLSASFTEQ